MTKRIVTIRDAQGIHMTVAEKIASRAMQENCRILLQVHDRELAADQFFGLLGLGARYGDSVTILADGDGEEEAADAIAAILDIEWHADKLTI